MLLFKAKDALWVPGGCRALPRSTTACDCVREEQAREKTPLSA